MEEEPRYYTYISLISPILLNPYRSRLIPVPVIEEPNTFILLDKDSRDLSTFSDGVFLYRFHRIPFVLNCSHYILTAYGFNLSTPNTEGMGEELSRFFNVRQLGELFILLTQNGVKLNLSKCAFGVKEVIYLGHRISARGSRPLPKNVEVIIKMKAPETMKEVKRFMGICQFYCEHIPSFAQIAIPLINLTKSNTTYKWDESYQITFAKLKECLIDAPILVKAQVN
ncbi:uncharacterized protein LOC143029991 [Oratosquilla oratoria]|uniref:uncharacterized protein LOC143029991 n=1 Tax=Oratosquilla oratoria TaxID=337810 RepID=UPI003F7675D9